MISKITRPTKASEIQRAWHLFDADKKILGRIASEISTILMGKSKPYYVGNLDCGDYVVVVNAEKVKVTGNKETKKIYFRHSGYPGGDVLRTLAELRQEKPEDIIKFAVLGMLPQNKLRDRMLTRLFIYKGENHPYQSKFSVKKDEKKA
jgi:large subunit ribosomal protein L13